MRRLVCLTILALTLTVGSGCSLLFGSVNQEFAEASKGFADQVLPEYENYLDADTSLSEDDRRIRRNSAKGWRELIDDALSEE